MPKCQEGVPLSKICKQYGNNRIKFTNVQIILIWIYIKIIEAGISLMSRLKLDSDRNWVLTFPCARNMSQLRFHQKVGNTSKKSSESESLQPFLKPSASASASSSAPKDIIHPILLSPPPWPKATTPLSPIWCSSSSCKGKYAHLHELFFPIRVLRFRKDKNTGMFFGRYFKALPLGNLRPLATSV